MKRKGPLVISLSLLVFNIWLDGGWTWAAQPTEGTGINYKLVRNLELMKREPAPDFTLAVLSAGSSSSSPSLWSRLWNRRADSRSPEKMIALKDFRDKVVLLNFWASWCDPCREEMPAMEKLYKEFKDRGFVVLAVDVKDSQRDAMAFVNHLKLTYPVVFDPEGKAGLLYGAWGLPATYLIGRTGHTLARLWGPADWHSPGARKLIQTLVEQQ